MKPEKIVYENQQKVHDLIIKKLKLKHLANLKEAYLIGSLANGNFGRYLKPYEGFLGSDIDVVALPVEIPKKWKYGGEFYNWHKKYYGGKIIIQKIPHPINFMVPFNQDISLFFQKVKELNWKVERLK